MWLLWIARSSSALDPGESDPSEDDHYGLLARTENLGEERNLALFGLAGEVGLLLPFSGQWTWVGNGSFWQPG